MLAGSDARGCLYCGLCVGHRELRPEHHGQHAGSQRWCGHRILWGDQLCCHRSHASDDLNLHRVHQTHLGPDSATVPGTQAQPGYYPVLHCSMLGRIPAGAICPSGGKGPLQ